MMKYIAIIFVFAGQMIFGQQFLEKERISSKIYILNETEIRLTQNSISIEDGEGSKFSQNINGVKIFQSSPENEYFFVANFDFPDGKDDYPVTVFVFDKASNNLFTRELKAHYDLPHPIFSINDSGIFGSLDLLSMQAVFFDGSNETTYSLEKDPEFEMERSVFFEMTGSAAYVFASVKPAAVEFNENFTSLYKIDLQRGTQQKIESEITSPTFLKNVNGEILTSGIRFEGINPNPSTIIFDEQLNETFRTAHAMEQLIKIGDKYYSKYAGTISVFDEAFNHLNSFQLEGAERVKELAEFNGRLVAASESLEGNFLYRFDDNLNIENKVRLNISGFNQIEGLETSDSELIIRMPNNSIILN